MIGEHEFLDMTWWYASYAYADEDAALKAWERLQRIGERTNGKMNIGAYRHGSSVSGPVIVTAVGHVHDGVKGAEQILQHDGFENVVPDEDLRALIARRVSMLARFTAVGTTQGSYAIRRDRPTTMRPDGTMDE